MYNKCEERAKFDANLKHKKEMRKFFWSIISMYVGGISLSLMILWLAQ